VKRPSKYLYTLRGILISVRDDDVVIGDIEIITVAWIASIVISSADPNILAAQKVQLERPTFL